MTSSKHILTTFDEALEALRNNVLIMSSLTARSLENALKGLRDRNNDLCLQAIADDEEIDQLEKQIDKDGVDLLIRFQPVASDLSGWFGMKPRPIWSGSRMNQSAWHEGAQAKPASRAR